MLTINNKTKITPETWLKEVEKIKAIYNFIIGGRNGRKSTKIQSKILKDYFKNGDLFLLIRRKTDETVTEKWFTPYIMKELEKKHKKTIIFKKSLTKGERYTGYFLLTDLDGHNPEIIGKLMYLSCEQKYKSNEADIYSCFKNVVYEEFIAVHDKAYLINEVQALVNLISTVFRDRKATIYLIGNTLDGQATNPYFRYFEIDDIELQVNDLIICENEYNIKIVICYVANVLNNNIPEYQKIKNNLVGTTGEWKQDNNLLEQDINALDAEITTITLQLQYRNRIYYIYSILEKEFKRPYIYITKQCLLDNGINTFNDFLTTIPKEHRHYKTTLLHALYPKFFKYSYSEHKFIFVPENKPSIKNLLIIEELDNIKSTSKNDKLRQLEQLQQTIYNQQVFCDNKSLLFWIRNERKEYIKNIVF